MTITFTLNGTRRSVSAEPGESLQELLQRMGIPSVRRSDDGEGFVGSDTILLDGTEIRVLTLDALIVAKRAMGRPRDLHTVLELEVIRERRNGCGA